MKIVRQATAGTFESSDAFVAVSPADNLEIEIDSIVFNQYGKAINDAVKVVLDSMKVSQGRISIKDRGAIDCVIQARVETAVLRACEGENK